MLVRGNGFRFAVLGLLVAVISIAPPPARGTRVGLYEDTDFLDILDGTNFNEMVTKANTSYVIEFYNAYCGHCIRYAATWKEFGLQVYGNNKPITYHL